MLSGIPAFTWARVCSIAYPIGLGLMVLGLLDMGVARSALPPAVMYVPAGIALATAGIGFIGFLLRRRSEFEAGYTTLYTSPNVDQLDHRTGLVIRQAGSPLLVAPSLFRRRSVGAATLPPARDQTSAAFPPRSVGNRVVSTGVSILVAVIVIAGVAARGASHGGGLLGALTTLAWAFGIMAVIAAAVFIGVRTTVSRRVRQVASRRPGAMIFTSTKTADLVQGAVKLGAQIGGTGRFQVVTTDADLELWDGEAETPALSIPWSEVAGLEPGVATVGRTPFKSLDLSVVRDGQKVLLSLPIYGQQAFLPASSAWANQIFDELQFHLVTR
jgi:hypothetical protein